MDMMITKATTVSELRGMLESCDKEILKAGLKRTEDGDDKEILRHLFLLVCTLKGDPHFNELKNPKSNKDAYKLDNKAVIDQMMQELLRKYGFDEDDYIVERWGSSSKQEKHALRRYDRDGTVFSRLFDKKQEVLYEESKSTYICADALQWAMQDIKYGNDNYSERSEDSIGNGSIWERFELLKAAYERAIKGSVNNLREQTPGIESELKGTCDANLEKCWDELLRILMRACCDEEKNVKDMLNSGIKQLILTGAPGTGKTRMAKRVAEELGGELKDILDDKSHGPKYYKLVQFHPSYDYTDFVEGLRPFENGDKIGFRKMDGVFKAFCRGVADKGDKDKKYFFIIDEINRADLSKVFGELMYCLETDKRGEKIDTQYQNLPTYGKDGNELDADIFSSGFYIPENVYIIGTMNDIDRSVESMDFALRRRFAWKEIKVSESSLRIAFSDMIAERAEAVSADVCITLAEKLAEQVVKLNKCLHDEGKKYGLNRHFDISQGQFADLPDAQWKALVDEQSGTEPARVKTFLEYAWNNRIKMLIEEYVRGENEADDFVKKCANELLR